MASIYSPTDYNPKIIKSEGSTVISQRGANTYKLIDPNPDMEIVPLEDLFIFVDLKARTRPRSLIKANVGEKTYNLTVLQGTVVSVGAGDQSQNTGGGISAQQLFNGLTTDWTEIGGIGSIKATGAGQGYDPQGFAITNIDISIKSQAAPTVVIDFVDVRGATLFEQGSCSPYGFFFQLPYPIFELTVKGYYGKAVTYYLNLVKFNTKFNSENGNFECRAEFVGYSFAFLSDILMGYVMAAPFLPAKYNFEANLKKIYEDTIAFYEETEKQRNPNYKSTLTIETFCPSGKCLTLFKLIKALKEFEQAGGGGIGSADYKKVQNLGLILNLYNSYRQSVEDLISSLSLKYSVEPTRDLGLPNGKRPIKVVFGDEVIGKAEMTKLLSPTGELFNFFDRTSGQAASKIKDILSKTLVADSGIESGGITCLSNNPSDFGSSATTTTYPLYNSNNLVNTAWFGGGGTTPGSSLASLGYISSDLDGKYDLINPPGFLPPTGPSGPKYYIDFGFILNDIDREIRYIIEKIDVENDNYAANIEKKIIAALKFSPTISSVFSVLMANTEAFMEVLKTVSVEAEKYHEKEDLTSYTANGGTSYVENTNIPNNGGTQKTVYSWPTYSVTEGSAIGLGEVEKYPGTNSNFKNWPEILFVEDFLKAFLNYQEAIEKLFNPPEASNYVGQPGQDNFVPINPLESRAWHKSGNGYYGKTSKPDILKTIGERLFINLDHNIFNPIRFTHDAFKIRDPKKNGNLVIKFIDLSAKLDVYNLLNATKNVSLINGWIPSDLNTFITDVTTQLGTNLKTVQSANVSKILNIKNRIIPKSTDPKEIEFIGIPLTATYYSYVATDGITIKKDEAGNPVKIFSNPFKMDPKNLFKIIKPDEIAAIQEITISNQKFNDWLNNTYKSEILNITKDFGFDDNIFKDSLGLKDLVKFNDDTKNQQCLTFSNPILFTTLGMSYPSSGSITLSGPATGSLSDAGDLGSMASNMGMISYWSYADNDTQYEVTGVDLLFRTKRDAILGNEDTVKISIEGFSSAEVFKINNFYTPLVTTPMWLDNVIKFRTLVRDKATAEKNYTEPTQYRNLAYLFLHSLKPTPLYTRLISGEGVFAICSTDAFRIDDDKKYTTWGFHGAKNNSDTSKLLSGVRSSIPWAATAFNNIAGISKVPRMWVLAFGAQLWRWREFTGSAKGATWKKTMVCELCDISKGVSKPSGNDPLIQPGFNSYTSSPRTFYTDTADISVGNLRNDIGYYLYKIYDVTHKTNVNTKIPVSVFDNQINNPTKNLRTINENGNDWGGFTLEEEDDSANRRVGAFFYFSFNEYKPQLGLISKDLNVLDKTKINSGAYFAWPQTYIAPHHIPYISPDVTGKLATDSSFADLATGKGSDFTFLMDPYSYYQDYISFQNTTLLIGSLTRILIGDNTTTNDWGYSLKPYLEQDPAEYSDGKVPTKYFITSRSKIEDGNLGMIMQYLPDSIKDQFVQEFETFADSQEWKDLLKIIDPVNFGEPGDGSNLIGAGKYKYYQGSSSPSAMFDEDVDDRISLALDADETKVSDYFFNKFYLLLNTTPKVWYGYQNRDDNDPYFSNRFEDSLPDESGFLCKTRDFETYLTTFHKEYLAKKDERIKEINDGNGGGGGKAKSGPPTINPTEDNDLKLSIYRTFKSLSEKWLQRTADGSDLFFNIGGASSVYCKKNQLQQGNTSIRRTLASYFVYVSRVWGDIGNKSVIDIRRLNEIKDNNKLSLYQMITDILSENEYLFFGLPTYINFTGTNGMADEDLKDMFRPVLNLDDAGCGPLFVCMYVGGSSRKLNLEIGQQNCKIDNDQLSDVLNNVRDDGFSLEDIQQPPDIASGNFTAFKVLYGKQNQNHFKNIQLDQSEFTETAESLAVLDRLAASQGTQETSKGQNLTSAYLTRSYTCSIETMGNMMIQPMTYFDLQGIPMFSGAYLITDVSHNIKPNNATTTFKGVRQPRTIVPIVNSIAVAMKLVPSKLGGGGGLLGGGGVGDLRVGCTENYKGYKDTILFIEPGVDDAGRSGYLLKAYYTKDPRTTKDINKLIDEYRNATPTDGLGDEGDSVAAKYRVPKLLRNVIAKNESRYCYSSHNWYDRCGGKECLNSVFCNEDKGGKLSRVKGEDLDKGLGLTGPVDITKLTLKQFTTAQAGGYPRLFCSGKYAVEPDTLKGCLSDSNVIDAAKESGMIMSLTNTIDGKYGIDLDHNKYVGLTQEVLLIRLLGGPFQNFLNGPGEEKDLIDSIDKLSQTWAPYPKYSTVWSAALAGTNNSHAKKSEPVGYLSVISTYGTSSQNSVISRYTAYEMARFLIEVWLQKNPGKTPTFGVPELDKKLDDELAVIGSLVAKCQDVMLSMGPPPSTGTTAESLCAYSNVPITFDENSTNIFMGDSLVGTMHVNIKSDGYKDKIAIGPNCSSTTLKYIYDALTQDDRFKDKVFDKVKEVFISNGANYGYASFATAKKHTEDLAPILKKMFPKAQVYIVPGGGCWAAGSPLTCIRGGATRTSCKDVLNLTDTTQPTQPEFFKETFLKGSTNEWKVIKPDCWDRDCSCLTQADAHTPSKQIYKDDVKAMIEIIGGTFPTSNFIT